MITLFDKIFSNFKENKIAVIQNEKEITYKELFDDCQKIVNFLKIFGKNIKICIYLPNDYISVLIFIASSKLKFTVFPLNSSLSIGRLKEFNNIYKFDVILSECDIDFAKKSITTKKIFQLLKENLKSRIGCKTGEVIDNDYIILLSSGSTGNPKPILLTQKNKFLRSVYAGKTYKINKNEIFIQPYNLDHSIGQRIMFMSLIHSGTLVLMKTFNVDQWFRYSQLFKVTFSLLVSYHIKDILRNKNLVKLKTLKNVVSVSDILEENVRKKILKYDFKFHEIYGTTEISTVANISHRKNSISKSVGKVLSFVDVKILDENKQIVAEGVNGEIACKTPLMFKKYYNDTETTKKNFFTDYFLTGDIGYIKNGYLFFTGRKKNIIKISGLIVYPEDVESVIKELPFVNNCIVKGEYDEKFGQKIVAYVTGKDYKKKVYEHCLNKLEYFQVPTKYIFKKEFPKTNIGKINRKLVT